MVADLLSGFVDEPWVADLELASLERVNATLHAEDMDRREGDLVWRVRRRSGGAAYVYVALEFQSTSDRWMAVRVMAYVALLYLHLIREGQVGSADRLPPVFPVVLYNGAKPWEGKAGVQALIARQPDGRPWAWRPRLRYHLVQERLVPPDRLTPDRFGASDNAVAMLFALEQCRTADGLVALLGRLSALLQDEGNATLRRAFGTWLRRELIPAHMLKVEPEDLSAIAEVKDMLAERIKEWEADLLQRGEARGLANDQAIAMRRTLLRYLERRLGQVPPPIADRIHAADTRLRESWLDRAMDGDSLADIFAADFPDRDRKPAG